MTIPDTIGITLDAFRIAGETLLFVTAFEIIYGQRQYAPLRPYSPATYHLECQSYTYPIENNAMVV